MASRARGAETVRLRIGNLAKAVLISGQTYQDPKDALHEFVSNAADEYVEAGLRGERIRVVLRRKGRAPVVAVDDVGRGMGPDRLREVARNLFESEKSGDDRTLGEKAIGVLAFQQLGACCEIVSRTAGSDQTWTLRLERGKASARLARERRRARQLPGTTVYVRDLDPDVLRVLTRRKVVDYLRARRGPALARGDYLIEVVEGRTGELVTPHRPDGIRLDIPARSTLWGRVEVALHVAPSDGRRRRVAAVGRAGATIIDDIAELDELARPPWTSDQVSGEITFAALRPTTGRRAVLRDRDAFPVFLHVVTSIEPIVSRAIARVDKQVDDDTAERLAEALRRLFARVLRELEDLESPSRLALGTEPGDGGLLEAGPATGGQPERTPPTDAPPPPLAVLEQPPGEPGDPPTPPSAQPARRRASDLPTVAPDPEPGSSRSRFDAETGTVLYNDRHADYLAVKDDDAALLDYLATLVAKEYVLFNNARAGAADVAEEMVRMLVRVRRHLPRRRGR